MVLMARHSKKRNRKKTYKNVTDRIFKKKRDSVGFESKSVAFLDILGFSELVKRSEEDVEIRDRIIRALDSIAGFVPGPKMKPEVRYTAFSDSVVISGPDDDFGLYAVAEGARMLGKNLLFQGILCRGGITVGFLHHSSDKVFGQGLIDAYLIESQTANYPRVVVDAKLVDRFSAFSSEWGDLEMLRQDFDGIWHIDLFGPVTWIHDKGRENLKERKILMGKLYDGLCAHIVTSYPDRPMQNRMKTNWLTSYFNEYVARHPQLEFESRDWESMEAAYYEDGDSYFDLKADKGNSER